jgi:hypothetical protein
MFAAARMSLEIGYNVCVFNSCSGGLTTDPEPSKRAKIGQVPPIGARPHQPDPVVHLKVLLTVPVQRLSLE